MDAVPHPELVDTLLALVAISLASLLGSISFAFGRRLHLVLPYLLAIASGILISTALTHLLPEAVEHLGNPRWTMLLFLLGLLGSFLLDRTLALGLAHWEGAGALHEHTPLVPSPSLAPSVLLGGAVHSFVDGVTIAVAFAVSHSVGVATTLAVFLHEVPHHVADVGILIYSGMSRWRATSLNLLATFGCAIGGVAVLISGLKSAAFTYTVLPLAAANFLYIGLGILVPELQREKNRMRSLVQTFSFLAAAGAMAAMGYWEPASP